MKRSKILAHVCIELVCNLCLDRQFCARANQEIPIFLAFCDSLLHASLLRAHCFMLHYWMLQCLIASAPHCLVFIASCFIASCLIASYLIASCFGASLVHASLLHCSMVQWYKSSLLLSCPERFQARLSFFSFSLIQLGLLNLRGWVRTDASIARREMVLLMAALSSNML